MNRMQEEIDAALGRNTWQTITAGCRPDGDMDAAALNEATRGFLAEFDRLADRATGNRVFSRVRHALTRGDFAWARERLLALGGDIDRLAEAVQADFWRDLEDCAAGGELFYGQPITREVLDYLRGIDSLFYGSVIRQTAIPFRALEYLGERDPLRKRYLMCHCQFARESILTGAPVSPTLCFCSMGHTKLLWEAALDTELQGDVVRSALGGDMTCEFVIHLPEEILARHVFS